MPEQVRVGVIGTSIYADVLHLTGLESHPGAEIAAICGRRREAAERLAAKYKIPQIFSDYREMIEKAGLDAVVIVSPDDLHYPMVMAALDAGLHVSCEKPLALNPGHAKAMYEKAEGAGLKHMVFFVNRWKPEYRYLRELIDEGFIGRSFHCHMRYLAGGGGQRPKYAWRYDSDRANGVLADLGSHMIDLARWLVGDISRVSAHLSTFLDRPGPDGNPLNAANDSAVLAVEFVDGTQGIIHASAVAHQADRSQEQEIVLRGESGTLEADYNLRGTDWGRGIVRTESEIRGARRDEPRFATLSVPDRIWAGVDRNHAYEALVKHSAGSRLFIEAIIDDKPISPNFYDGFKAQEVIDAAITSHNEGRWVSLASVAG